MKMPLKQILLLIVILFGCQSLDNGGGTDWVKAEFTVCENSEERLKQASLSWDNRSALILAVPAEVTDTSQIEYIIPSYDKALQDISSGRVRLNIPLNTDIRLVKVDFISAYSLDTIVSDHPFACSSGLSEPFRVDGNQDSISIRITMRSLPPEATGTLYTGFDEDGIAIHHNAAGGDDNDFGLATFFDRSGRLLVSGYSKGVADMDMSLWRYNRDGNLDTTLNSTGFLTRNGDAGAPSTIGEIGYDLVLDRSNRILVAGTAWSASTADTDMAIWRFDADGTPDSSFGSAGLVSHHNAAGGDTGDLAREIAVDSQGRIITVGYSGNGSNYDVVIWRYLEDGTPDTSFDGDGVLVHHDAAGGDGNDFGYALAIDSANRIIVAGMSDNGSNNDMVLWRYNTPGSLDTSFGSGGIVVYNGTGNGDDKGHVLALDDDGRILVSGYSSNGTDYDMALWRYTTTGTLDTTFGNGGIAVFDNPNGGDDKGNAIIIDSSGKIVVAGIIKTGALGDMALWRYTSAGTLDADFGNGGYVTHDAAAGGVGDEEINPGSFGNRDNGLAIGPEGRIYVIGTSKNANDDKDMVIWSYQ